MHVLLVHGMGRTPLSFLRLARALRRAGHSTEMVGYVAAVERFAGIRRRVRNRLEAAARRGEPYAAIGHSLGGVLLRSALAGWPPSHPPPAELILLGTPHSAARLARMATRFRPVGLLLGQSGRLLARESFFRALPPCDVPCLVIAGTKGWRTARAPFGGAPNDGIVAVEEVRPRGTAEFVEVPAGHTFMMRDRRVMRLVLAALSAAASRSAPEAGPPAPGAPA